MIWRLALILFLLATPLTAWGQASVVTASGGITASGTTHTPTMPASIAAGNLIVAIVAPNNPITALTTPTGYTKMTTCSSFNEIGVGVETWYRHATGDASDDITSTSTGTGTVAYSIRRITDHLAATAPECSSPAMGTSTAPNPSALTPSAGSANYLWIAAAAFDTTPAPTCSLLTGSSGSSTTDATSFTTASVTLTAGRFYTLYVASRVTTGPVNNPTATSTGATWVNIVNQGFDNSDASGVRQTSALRTMVTTTQTAAITIDFAGQTQLAANWAIVECAGADVGGTDGSGAVVVTNQRVELSETSTTLTFAAFGGANNRPIVGFGTNTTNTAVISIDWTELSEIANADGLLLSVGWLDSTADTTATLTTTGGLFDAGSVGIEVKGLTGNATVSAHPTDYADNQRNDGAANGTRIGSSSRTTTAVSEDPGVYTLDLAETWYAFTIAVRPASAAAPSTPPPGFHTLTGNSWSQGSGVATPVHGFSVIKWHVGMGQSQHVAATISTLPNVGDTVQVAFRIQDANNRYRCALTIVSGASNDTVTLIRVHAGSAATLAGPVNLGIDAIAGDSLGAWVHSTATNCNYKSSQAPFSNAWKVVVAHGAALASHATTHIGIGAAPPAAVTEFFGQGDPPGEGPAAASVPTGCVATVVSNASISLACTASTGGVISYRDEECSGTDCTNFAQIRDTEAPVYLREGLTPLTLYRYRRCAFNGVVCSSYSSIFEATTLDNPAPHIGARRTLIDGGQSGGGAPGFGR